MLGVCKDFLYFLDVSVFEKLNEVVHVVSVLHNSRLLADNPSPKTKTNCAQAILYSQAAELCAPDVHALVCQYHSCNWPFPLQVQIKQQPSSNSSSYWNYSLEPAAAFFEVVVHPRHLSTTFNRYVIIEVQACKAYRQRYLRSSRNDAVNCMFWYHTPIVI